MSQHEELARCAKELVDAEGRQITVNAFSGTPQDPDKPWNGPANPTGPPDLTATPIGVFVPPSGAAQLGMRAMDEDLKKTVDSICIVAPGFDNPPFNLSKAHEIIDQGVKRSVVFVDVLKPGQTTLLYFIAVQR